MIATFRGEYAFLSNFYLTTVNVFGGLFVSSEHAYMSQKSDDPEWKKFCQDQEVSCSEVKAKSQTVKLVPGWDDMRIDIMHQVLTAKFQIEYLKQRLFKTGDQNLQEGNRHGDKFWGVDLTSNPNIGENHLGRLLMRIREELKISL